MRKSQEEVAAEKLARQQARISLLPERISMLWGLITFSNRFTCDKCHMYVEHEGSWIIPNLYPRNSVAGVEWEFCLLCCPTREVALSFHKRLLSTTTKNSITLKLL